MQPLYSGLHCQFLSHVLKTLFFYQNSPKIRLFLQKMQNFRRLGAPPPNPVPPEAGGSAPKPPDSGGWGLRPQTPKTAPHCEFLATRLIKSLSFRTFLTTSLHVIWSLDLPQLKILATPLPRTSNFQSLFIRTLILLKVILVQNKKNFEVIYYKKARKGMFVLMGFVNYVTAKKQYRMANGLDDANLTPSLSTILDLTIETAANFNTTLLYIKFSFRILK